MKSPAIRRFAIALSFPGEKRDYIHEVAQLLSQVIGKDRLLYDRFHDAELSRPNLDVYLPNLYADESDLIVVFLTSDYPDKWWCRCEWRAIRQIMLGPEEGRIMFLSFGEPRDLRSVGIYSGDGYLDILNLSAQATADKILIRASQPPSPPKLSHTILWSGSGSWDFSAYIREKRLGFVGRHWLFDEVRTWLGASEGPQALLACGDYGVGKSAFMAELVAGSHGLPIAAHYFCHHDTIETLNPVTFVRTIASQLSRTFPAFHSALGADPDAQRLLGDVRVNAASMFEGAVVIPLTRIDPPDMAWVLALDALDEALDFKPTADGSGNTTIIHLLAHRAKRLPGWLRVLATSRRRQDVLVPMKQAFLCSQIDAEDSRNLDDIRLYLETRCVAGPLCQVLAKSSLPGRALVEYLSRHEVCGGKFLYAQRVLNDIEHGALVLSSVHDLDALPPGLDGFYLDAFERRFPKTDDFATARAVLGVLVAVREPISPSDLAAILSIGVYQVKETLATIQDFLCVNDQRFALGHFSLLQWLTEDAADGFARAGRYFVDVLSAESQLLDWARDMIGAQQVHESQYLVRHLGAHLSLTERKKVFPGLMLDFRWLDARLREAGVSNLLADFIDLDVNKVIQTLERVLHQSSHVLLHDNGDWQGSHQLASQLLARLPRDPQRGVDSARCFDPMIAQAFSSLAIGGSLLPLKPSLLGSSALLRTLEGHTSAVLALVVLPDGILVSGSNDWSIRLWNTISGVCEAILEGHTGPIRALAILEDGRLASGSADGTIKLWNLACRVCEATLEVTTAQVCSLALLPDGRLVSGSDDGLIRLWNPDRCACEATLTGHEGPVWALEVLMDGRLASGSVDDEDIFIWNLVDKSYDTLLDSNSDHRGGVGALALLLDGSIVCGSLGCTVTLWDSDWGSFGSLYSNVGPVWAFAALADGRLACGSSGKYPILILDTDNCASEEALVGHSAPVFALTTLSDGRLVSGSGDNTIKIWDPALLPRAWNWNLKSENLSIESLITVCEQYEESGDAARWLLEDSLTERTRRGALNSLAPMADGKIVSGSAFGWIELWNPVSGDREPYAPIPYCQHSPAVTALSDLGAGKFASGATDNAIKLWDVSNGRCEATLEGHSGFVSSLVGLADGRLVSGSCDHTIKLWNRFNGDCEATLDGHAGAVNSLVVLADGHLASGSDDRTIKLWSPASYACDTTLEGHRGIVSALQVLRSGQLASASEDGTIRLWCLASGVCHEVLEGHSGPVSALAELHDGRIVSSGSEDKTIRIWSIAGHGWTPHVAFVSDAGLQTLVFMSGSELLVAGDLGGALHFLRVDASMTPLK